MSTERQNSERPSAERPRGRRKVVENEPTPEDIARATEHARIERRAFLRQAVGLGGACAAAGYLSLAPPSWPLSLKDPDGERGKPAIPVRRLPEGGFKVADAPSVGELGVAHGTNIKEMMRAAVSAIGGIERFISRGDVVVIKPNVAFERPAALGATTNPEVLVALIELVREAGAAEIRVADNPIESPESCFARSGIRAATLQSGAKLYLPEPAQFELLGTSGATHIERWPFFWRPFDGAHKVIGVSPIKDHNLCRASMTTKNWYGLLGGRRNQFHQDIHGIIADLALMLRPTFVVLDATRVLFRSGPTGGSLGDVKAGNTIVASRDSLAADAFGWDQLLERKGEPLPAYFEKAAARGLGQPDWRKLALREVSVG
jgi:uncharacterized protein (DUF362 family)